MCWVFYFFIRRHQTTVSVYSCFDVFVFFFLSLVSFLGSLQLSDKILREDTKVYHLFKTAACTSLLLYLYVHTFVSTFQIVRSLNPWTFFNYLKKSHDLATGD